MLSEKTASADTQSLQSRVPITSISISKLGALKSRDALVGLSMPTVLQFPDLNALGELASPSNHRTQ